MCLKCFFVRNIPINKRAKGKCNLWQSQISIKYYFAGTDLNLLPLAMWDILWLTFIRNNCKVCFPFLGYAWTWLWKCINFFSAIIYYTASLWFTTFVYTTFYYDTLKPKGGATALLSPSGRFLGTSFPALVHLVFKSLKHLASVDTK